MGHALAGYSAGRTYTPREIAAGGGPLEYAVAGVILDGTNGADGSNTGYTEEWRAGLWLGKITASGLYVPCKRTLVNGTSGSVTAVVVDHSLAFKIGDAITIGGDAVTLTNVNHTTKTLTWVGAVTVADNDIVIGTDGSQVARGVLGEFARLRNSDNTAAANKSAKMVIGGPLNKDMLLGDTDAILADSTALLERIKLYASGALVR
jgi:hypothetical protein